MRDNPLLGQESDLRYAVVPLIHSKVVEWHRLDRVLRQFGLFQNVPQHFDTGVALHFIDRRVELPQLTGQRVKLVD